VPFEEAEDFAGDVCVAAEYARPFDRQPAGPAAASPPARPARAARSVGFADWPCAHVDAAAAPWSPRHEARHAWSPSVRVNT
jgi:hypothetical protein